MSELIKKLEIRFRSSANKIRLLDVYNYSIYLYTEIEKSERNKVILKIDELAGDQGIPLIKIIESYATIAWILHVEGDYQGALDCFNKIQSFEMEPFLPHLIYMADCQRHLELPIHIPLIEQSSLCKYSMNEQFMYNFYRDYNRLDSSMKQTFIIKKIAPGLKDKTLIKIFEYEINKLAEETNSYKNFYLFKRIVERDRY